MWRGLEGNKIVKRVGGAFKHFGGMSYQRSSLRWEIHYSFKGKELARRDCEECNVRGVQGRLATLHSYRTAGIAKNMHRTPRTFHSRYAKCPGGTDAALRNRGTYCVT